MSSTIQSQQPTKERLEINLILDEFRAKLCEAVRKDIEANGNEGEYEEYIHKHKRDLMSDMELLESIKHKVYETIREESIIERARNPSHSKRYIDCLIKPDLLADVRQLFRSGFRIPGQRISRDSLEEWKIFQARLEGYYEALDLISAICTGCRGEDILLRTRELAELCQRELAATEAVQQK